jgi:TolB-like protein/Tfp pilus assembly protein PilF
VRSPELASLVVAGLALVVALGAIVWSKRDAGTTSVPQITSIAVLPLAEASETTSSPFFAEGLTDQLIATLGQIRSVRVASRTSVMQFKNSTLPIQQVFDALGVDALVEGTVTLQRAPDGSGRVRVNARLIPAGTGTALWSKTLERPLGDSLALESDLAREIAEAVHATVTESESRRLGQVRSTNPAAEEAYFQGRYHLGQFGVERAKRALEAFNRAIDLDPNHAAAHAGAARSYFNLGFAGALSQADARIRAMTEINRALAIDADVADAQVALGDLKFFYDWDWTGGEAAYRRAVELNPSFSYARGQYARYLAAAQRVDEAVVEATAAVALDPLSADAGQTLGLVRYYAKDYDGAVAALQRALELDPRSARARAVLGRVHDAQGRSAEALAETRRAIEMSDEPAVSWRMQLIRLQAIAGDVKSARAQFAALSREVDRRQLRIAPEHLGYYSLAIGNQASALDHLERAVQDRDPGVLWLAVDPRVEPLRDDPRFQSIVAKLSIPRR